MMPVVVSISPLTSCSPTPSVLQAGVHHLECVDDEKLEINLLWPNSKLCLLVNLALC